jgi:predicted signal transduction protein with EAL and GGDEF domain
MIWPTATVSTNGWKWRWSARAWMPISASPLFLDWTASRWSTTAWPPAGNQLLHEVAQRLCACVRATDVVARLGGDEFAILLESLHDPESGLRLAQRVLDTLSQPLSINGTEVVPGASVGITFSDLGYRTVDEVLRDADLAMYEAKAAGRGRVALFDSSMHERVAEKLALESDLRHAIGEGQLSVHFQPLFELEPYKLCGFEALARWVHPERGP